MLPFERLEKVFIPGEMSLEDRTNIFHERVYQEIKRMNKAYGTAKLKNTVM